MRRTTALPWLLVASLLPFSPARAQGSEQIAAELRKAASNLPVFSAGDFLYNRFPRLFYREREQAAYEQTLRRLTDANYPASAVIPLLSDPEPAVRTLAMAVLFDKEDPQLLPYLAPLTTDHAVTIPDLAMVASFPLPPAPIPTTVRTVGEIAEQMLRFYLAEAGYQYGVSDPRGLPGFSDYWARRKDRPYCASWARVGLKRATGGITPTPAARLSGIRRFRERIDRLPATDRDLYLLWLHPLSNDTLASEGELLDAARRLGREKILKILAGEPPSQDPDLLPEATGFYDYRRVIEFLMRHSEALLDPGDAPQVGGFEVRERAKLSQGASDSLLNPFYAIGRARLVPETASVVLRAALARFSQTTQGGSRGQLAASLWQLAGVQEADFINSWFHEESSLVGIMGPEAQRSFVEAMTAKDRHILERLLADPRIRLVRGDVVARIHERLLAGASMTGSVVTALLDWFYAQSPPKEEGHSDPNGQYFLEHLGRQKDHALLRSVIVDPRFGAIPLPYAVCLEQILVTKYRLPPDQARRMHELIRRGPPARELDQLRSLLRANVDSIR